MFSNFSINCASPRSSSPCLTRLMRCLISFVSVEGMSSLFFIGADRADPMPGKNERQGRGRKYFLFSRGLTAETLWICAACLLIQMRSAELRLGRQAATGARDDAAPGSV